MVSNEVWENDNKMTSSYSASPAAPPPPPCDLGKGLHEDARVIASSADVRCRRCLPRATSA